MAPLNDISTSGTLTFRLGDQTAFGYLDLGATGWRVTLNALQPNDEPVHQDGFPTSADAMAWVAQHPGIPADFSTVPGAQTANQKLAVLPLTPWEEGQARMGMLLSPQNWRFLCRKIFSSDIMPTLLAWNRQDNGAWAIAGGLREESDGRWTVWRLGHPTKTYARRQTAENTLGAHLGKDACSAHARLAMAEIPAMAIQRLRNLKEPEFQPQGPPQLSLGGRLVITRRDGTLLGDITFRAGEGWQAAPRGGTERAVFKTVDGAAQAVLAASDRLRDLRKDGAEHTDLGLVLPLAGGATGPRLDAPLRSGGLLSEQALHTTGTDDGIEAVASDGRTILAFARRGKEQRLRVVAPHGYSWPRGRNAGKLAKNEAHALLLLAKAAKMDLSPEAIATAAARLHEANRLSPLCPKGGVV